MLSDFSSSDRLRPPDEWWKILGSRSTSQFKQPTSFWENASLDRNGRRPDPEEEATALTRFRNIQHRWPKAIEQQHFGSSWSGRLRLPDEGPKMFLNQCTYQLKQPTGRKLLTDFIDLIGLDETHLHCKQERCDTDERVKRSKNSVLKCAEFEKCTSCLGTWLGTPGMTSLKRTSDNSNCFRGPSDRI